MKFFLVCLLIGVSLLSIMSCNFDTFTKKSSSDHDSLKMLTRAVPILLSENLSQEQPEEYHSAKKLADERFKTSGYKNPRDWWRLVCQAIDQEYYQFTGSFKSATTESEKQIWLNILRATINDIHQDVIANNKGHQTVMSKKKIKRNILKACP